MLVYRINIIIISGLTLINYHLILPKQILLYFVVLGKKYLKSQVKIKLNGIVVEQVQSAKFLGVHIDEHLKWDKQTLLSFQKILES